MTYNQKIFDRMMIGFEYRACDVVDIYYDAPRRLRGMAERFEKTKIGFPIVRREGKKFTYFKRIY